MNDPAYEAVELRLAEKGTDLWSAVEAAQFARFIHHEELDEGPEMRALTRFADAFSHCTEGWERTPLTMRAAALQGLGAELEALKRAGLFVHWATVERDLAKGGREPVRMTVAILTITRTRLPTVRARVPRQVAGVSA
ncbi:MAG TPA: hypothetical protein VFG47_09860 [Geminicoccaceae bacterium]|jgi:hypothetical protein|nr:hypothetical protein [Geminicoccaceae bacterium]